eukprot:CAMPEP_0168590514 /NCGR_PEP_ID=MMETSP0420-20121227/6613_1 /TAXON_ID=498008 /ORGANISM="Pessonella sp." /LENGTH=282 /DNA_ID=CAMNT_0008626187 /DNA_START=132 /DNA_END=980 /DNA_ORIENTATION=-
MKTYGAGSGYWAAVTGASDGIGKAYAKQLAKDGFNVVLISRTESKLNAVAEEIENETQAKTKVVAIDFANADDSDWSRVEKALAKLKLGVLVNNAGLSHEMPETFLQAPVERIEDIVAVNIVAVNKITLIALPILLNNKANNLRGLVLNVGSVAGLLPTPLLAVYGASKSYLSDWSAALQREYAPEGVDVDCSIAAFVVSNMSKRSRPTAMIPLPGAFVKSSLAKVGHGDLPSAPFFAHGILEFILQSIPLPLLSKVVDKNLDMHVDIRKRALAKKARNAKK